MVGYLFCLTNLLFLTFHVIYLYYTRISLSSSVTCCLFSSGMVFLWIFLQILKLLVFLLQVLKLLVYFWLWCNFKCFCFRCFCLIEKFLTIFTWKFLRIFSVKDKIQKPLTYFFVGSSGYLIFTVFYIYIDS